MTPRTLAITDLLQGYLHQVGFREREIQRRLREETLRLQGASMLLAPEQGAFMALLVRLLRVERYIEIGTFTGYSALAVALSLGASGRVVTCDIDPDNTRIARRYWEEAGVADRIELILGPALSTLEAMLPAGRGEFDMAFIDADKENLIAYYERCLSLVRPGGLILVDNTLWGGAVADPLDREASTETIRAFNAAVQADARVDMVLLPIGDGLMLAAPR
jgi:caffeoyl-CoA O-methyltransferase